MENKILNEVSYLKENCFEDKINYSNNEGSQEKPILEEKLDTDQTIFKIIDETICELKNEDKVRLDEKVEFKSLIENDAYHAQMLILEKISKNKEFDKLFYENYKPSTVNELLSIDVHVSTNIEDSNNFKILNLPSSMLAKLVNREYDSQCYKEICQLTVANMVLHHQVIRLHSEIKEVLNKICKLNRPIIMSNSNLAQNHKKETVPVNSNGLHSIENMMEKKKRFRRVADEIERLFKCPVSTCQKSYGLILYRSEGSLNQHLKIKHNNIDQKILLQRNSLHHANSQNQES